MRLIVNVQLENGNIMTIIGDVQNKEAAREMAFQLSPRLFKDTEMHVQRNSRILNVDRWSQERAFSYTPGGRIYLAAFLMNGVLQYMQIEGSGAKSAYNNIKVKYGIQENPFMLLYDTMQHAKSKSSALNYSKAVIKEDRKVNEVFNALMRKVSMTPEISGYSQQLSVIINMIKDARTGKYKGTSPNTIIAIFACLVYIIDTANYKLDIAPGIPDMNFKDAILWMLKSIDNEVLNYKKWIVGEQDEDIVLL